MKICWHGFLAKNHSWSHTAQSITRELIKKEHSVDLFSTNGCQYFPEDLNKNLVGYTEEGSNKIIGKQLSNDYDLAISYTAFINFPNYLSRGKTKFGIWLFEWAGKNVLPTGFAKNYKYCDYILAPSTFGKQVFMDSGIPESSIKVISHGIGDEYKNNDTVKLPTNKSFKILSNIAQNHIRKNIPGLLEAYGKAFTNKDDVCLILKAKSKKVTAPFEVSLEKCLADFYKKFPNHAEIKMMSDFIPDISSLYRSIDVLFSIPYCEGFFYPGLEAIASGKTVIAPNWGGQTDFLNESNALLVSGKETRADPKSMYWESKNNAIWFEPSIDDAVDKLKFAYKNFTSLNEKVEKLRPSVLQNYSWNNITDQIIKLV